MPSLITTHKRIATGNPRITTDFTTKFIVLMSRVSYYFIYDKSNRLIIARSKDGVQ